MESQQNGPPDWFRAAIRHEASRHTVLVDGGEIVYRRWGGRTDPALVLVHGNASHSHWWDHVAPLLADRHQVCAMDLSGFGDSTRRERYGTDQWVSDLTAVTEAVTTAAAGERPVVIAHSMGGIVAAAAAARVGTAWRGLVAVDSTLGQESLGYRPPPRSPVRGSVFTSAQEAIGRFRLKPPQPGSLPYVVHHIARHSIRQAPRGWEWKGDPRTRMASGHGLDPATLGKITCEMALLRAEHGRIVRDADLRLARLAGRPVPVVDIPEAHHHMMIDQPMAFVTALRTLLSVWGAHGHDV